MQVPDIVKPITWPLVGGIFRNFYESHAENMCMGLALVFVALAAWIMFAGFHSMQMGLFVGGVILAWGIVHLVGGALMLLKRELERQRRIEYQKRLRAQRNMRIES